MSISTRSAEPSSAHQRRPQAKPEKPPPLARCLIAEVFGTFALTFAAAGTDVANAISHGQISLFSRMAAPGLVVMAMIYSLGDASGAHYNPAVTLGFLVRGAFPWRRAPAYWAAQFAGGIGAAALLYVLFGRAGHVGATLPHHGLVASLVMEVVLTTFLLTAILGTASRYHVTGPNAALAVGGTIILDGLIGGAISGASMNPARSLGPALFSGQERSLWIYMAGPAAGALIAVLFMMAAHPALGGEETKVAEGEDGGGGR